MTPHEGDELPDWRHNAACHDLDPELFFPEGTAGPALRQAERAKQVCESCPSGPPCLDFALRHGLDYGIWGGVTGEERRFMRTAHSGMINAVVARTRR